MPQIVEDRSDERFTERIIINPGGLAWHDSVHGSRYSGLFHGPTDVA
jgi:hypothetical protein